MTMKASVYPSRPVFYLALLGAAFAALMFLIMGEARASVEAGRAKGIRRSGAVLAAVVSAPAARPAQVPRAAGGFAPQTRLGYTKGDQWEPAIAADRFGHIYILYPQYLGVPGCPECPSPTMILQVSNDRGRTWGEPRQIAPPGTGQWDAQIVVDPVDGRTVYAAWLQNGKSDTVVAKSTNFGVTWDVVVADSTNAGTDKPILAVCGPRVIVVFNHAQKVWAAYSHDGGATFKPSQINPNGKFGWSLAGGGAITPNGHAFFAWAGYEQNGGAKGPVNLYVSKSTDGGVTWTNKVLDVSGAPPGCAEFLCGWAYLGAQLTLASDAAGNLYALWNANSTDKAPNRIYFAKSINEGGTWSKKVDVSASPQGRHHAFPAIVAGAAGDVRISWMDARASVAASGMDRWNTYYRSSTNGGARWSAEVDLSTFVDGYSYIFADGFRFPFGDYYEMDLDDQGRTHVVWGEGFNYDSPGSIWYTRGP
jgi:hypothetical protein